MPIGATISAIGAVTSAGIGAAGSYFGSKAASKALAAQQAQNQSNLAPYMQFGQGAMTSLADLYGFGAGGPSGQSQAWTNFTNLPAYQFPLQQGMQALTRKLNAEGRTMSGAELRESQQFGQGLASTYMMSNYVNPLTQFAGIGATAASNLSNVNSNLAGQNAQAQAASYMGPANAVAGGIGNISNNLALYSMMGRNPSSYASMNPNGGNMIMAPNPNGGGISPMYT